MLIVIRLVKSLVSCSEGRVSYFGFQRNNNAIHLNKPHSLDAWVNILRKTFVKFLWGELSDPPQQVCCYLILIVKTSFNGSFLLPLVWNALGCDLYPAQCFCLEMASVSQCGMRLDPKVSTSL